MAYTAKDPRPPTAFSVPNRNVLYLRETKLWRCERRRGGGGRRGENVHLKTHAPLGGRVGKNALVSVCVCDYEKKEEDKEPILTYLLLLPL